MKSIKEDLINLVLSAISEIEDKYYAKDNYAFVYEKGFCYEFYHQFRLLLCQTPFKELTLSGEPYKNLAFQLSQVGTNIRNKKTVYPDFVLHKGLNDAAPENQLIAIEVKRKKQISNGTKRKTGRFPFENDIWKLRLLMEKFKFTIGVFIAIDADVKYLEKKLKENKELLKFPDNDKLYFIAVKSRNAIRTNTTSKTAVKYENLDEKQFCFTAQQFVGKIQK